MNGKISWPCIDIWHLSLCHTCSCSIFHYKTTPFWHFHTFSPSAHILLNNGRDWSKLFNKNPSFVLKTRQYVYNGLIPPLPHFPTPICTIFHWIWSQFEVNFRLSIIIKIGHHKNRTFLIETIIIVFRWSGIIFWLQYRLRIFFAYMAIYDREVELNIEQFSGSTMYNLVFVADS